VRRIIGKVGPSYQPGPSGRSTGAVRRWGGYCTAVAISLPMFVYASGAVYRGTEFESAPVYPISLVCAAMYLVIVAVSSRNIRINTRVFAALGVVMFVTAGLFLTAQGVSGPAFDARMWLIYHGPLVLGLGAGFVAAGAVPGGRLVDAMALTIAAVAAAHVVTSTWEMGIHGALVNPLRGTYHVAGLFSIYQKLTYYPFVLAFAASYLLFFARGLPILIRVTCVAAIAADLLIVAAREPFAMIAAFALIANIVRPRRSQIIALVLIVLVGAILSAAYAEVLEDSRFAVRMAVAATSGDVDLMTGRRTVMAGLFLDELRGGWLFGEAFLLREGFHSTPHNQYLELVLRGGVLTLLGFVYLLGRGISRGFRIADPRGQDVYAFGAVFLLVVMLVSFNINTALRAPYSAMVIWFLCGILMQVPPRLRRTTGSVE
jgi:hypothetical protein